MSMRVMGRENVFSCPWFNVVKKEVRTRDQKSTIDHFSVAQQDYVAILCVTRSGLIPLVRQYRPAIERYSLELPAGLLERGEVPESAARRELLEETGLVATETFEVQSTFADTGRLSSRFLAFFSVAEADESARVEEGLEVRFVSIRELQRLVLSNEFVLQSHIGVLYASAIDPRVAATLDRLGLPGLLGR